MVAECTYCGARLLAEELESPRERDGYVYCDDCWREYYQFTCCWCRELADDDDQHVMVVLFEAFAGADVLGDDLDPGLYLIVRFPYYADGIVEGHAYADAFEGLVARSAARRAGGA